MARRKSSASWGAKSDKQASDAVLYPHIRLAHAICKQAVVDLKEADPLSALPALAWWLQDAPDWLAMLELHDPDDDRYFSRLLENCDNGKKRKTSGLITEGN